MKKLVRDYIFDASARTVTANDFTSVKKIGIITNVTDNIIIYNFADPAKGGTLAGNVLTLDYDTTAMSDTDELRIDVIETTDLDRIGFAKAITNGVDSDFFTLVATGSGQTVNQTGGNLVLTTGTTARSETIIRSKQRYTGGIRFRVQTILSQRIANQQFFVELVDLVGDALAYTINSATSITVTFPAGHGLTSQNVGQFISLGNFAGTGTFFSGRYAIASVSGNDITFTVSGFAAGTGTCSAFGRNYYRLEYSGITATNVLFDTQRNGYASGNTTATISTTAGVGHQAIGIMNDGVATFADQLVASSTAIQTVTRANRVTMVPDDAQLYLQIRVVNGTTAPASTTTWTIGQVSIGKFEAESVIVQDVRVPNTNSALPVEIMRTVASSVSVTGYPTAAASADALANPTVTKIDATNLLFNGTTWDRQRNNQIATVDSSSARTASGVGTTATNFNARGALIFINVTGVTGTSPTMTVRLQVAIDGTNFVDYDTTNLQTVSITGVSTHILRVYPGIATTANSALNGVLPRTWRLAWTIGGTTPSFTFTTTVCYIL